MRPFLLFLVSTLIGSLPVLAQKMNLFSIHAGYLHTTTSVTWTSNVLIGLSPIEPKSGFYAGLSYEHNLSTLLTSQIDLTYQQKGYTYRSFSGESLKETAYNYIGITPMIGIKPIKNLRFFVGPALNLLLNRSTLGRGSQPVELGIAGGSRYQFKRTGLTIGYFKGLSAYYKSDFYYFTNQNWQAGLFYQLNKG